MDTMRDPAMLKEAKKSRLEIDPLDGPTIAKGMAALYAMNPATVSRLKEILVSKR